MNICIYAAASEKIDKFFKTKTEDLCEILAKNGHNLVYGAGSTGLMGAAARGFTKGNGKVVGVTPHFMYEIEPIYDKCTELIHTETMAERKVEMEQRAEAFIILPGGIGTFDEFFQCLTLKYLGIFNKEIIVYNMNEFYTDLLKYLDKCVEKKFIGEQVPTMYKIAKTPEEVLQILNNL